MRRKAWLLVLGSLLVGGCGASGASSRSAEASVPAHWVRFAGLRGVVDLSAPRQDGRFTVSAAGRLFLFAPGHAPTPFARGRGGYRARAGDEPYIAVSRGGRVVDAGCSFPVDAVYVLVLGSNPGIEVVNRRGRARRFTDFPPEVGPRGIAFDTVGRFGRRLLVIGAVGDQSRVFALDCRGRVRTLTSTAPKMEGGIAVAPRSFGRFGGQLIAPDEISGRIVAIDPQGAAETVARAGIPTGADIGVESAGFVPAGFTRSGAAYLADRGSPGSPTVGTNSILILRGAALARAGVAAGDLLVASEAGARTIAVRCEATCTVRHIADGPRVAHPEGHIQFRRR